MRTTSLYMLAVWLVLGCNERYGTSENFISKRIRKSASFIVNEPIDKVFPLYGAFEERKWAPGWEPILIYPHTETIEEGTTFKIKSHGHGHGGEGDLLWIVSKYEPRNYIIQYLVSTENRFWTITVTSTPLQHNMKTETTVTYTFTGLNEKGNRLNQKSIESLFKNDLQDWADAINSYFARMGKSTKT